MQTDEQKLLLAINAALEAGKEVNRIYHEGFEVEWKEDKSPVTKADLASDAIIRESLASSGLEIISEEVEQLGYEDRKHLDQYWCVDPIDGTRDFVNKTDNFCICIALIKNHKAHIGVIYLPVNNELYYGINGKGAYKAIAKEPVAQISDLASSSMPTEQQPEAFTVVATNYHMNSKTQAYIEQKQKEIPNMQVLKVGSAIKFCILADGKAHHYPRFGKMNDWDIAAGHAILEAAGGTVEPMFETEFKYNDEKLYRENFFAWMRR